MDAILKQALEQETLRQHNNIELIASENFTSPAVMAACGSVLTNKYAWSIIISETLKNFRQVANYMGVFLAAALLGSTSKFLLFGLPTGIGTAVGMLVINMLLKKFNSKVLYIASGIYSVIANVLAFTVGYMYFKTGSSVLQIVFIIFLFLIGLQFGASNLLPSMFQADVLEDIEAKTGKRIDATLPFVISIGTLISGTIANGLAPKVLYGDNSIIGYIQPTDLVPNPEQGLDTKILLLFFYTIVHGLMMFLAGVPFFFYNLTENKHRAYVDVLKIRAMFENYSLGALEDDELKDVMAIILQAKELYGKEKIIPDKSKLKNAKKMSKKSKEEKELRKQEIKNAKKELAEIKETNLAIERASIIMQDLEKFSTEAGEKRVLNAKEDFAKGEGYIFGDAKNQLKIAKKLPQTNKVEKEIREDEINRARVKKQALALVKKYGEENIKEPNILEKEEILNRETNSFKESMKQRKDLRAYLKKESIYLRATKPFREADNLIKQTENYTHYEELVEKYETLTA